MVQKPSNAANRAHRNRRRGGNRRSGEDADDVAPQSVGYEVRLAGITHSQIKASQTLYVFVPVVVGNHQIADSDLALAVNNAKSNFLKGIDGGLIHISGSGAPNSQQGSRQQGNGRDVEPRRGRNEARETRGEPVHRELDNDKLALKPGRRAGSRNRRGANAGERNEQGDSAVKENIEDSANPSQSPTPAVDQQTTMPSPQTQQQPQNEGKTEPINPPSHSDVPVPAKSEGPAETMAAPVSLPVSKTEGVSESSAIGQGENI